MSSLITRNKISLDVYGIPPSERINHCVRIYGLAVIFALVALFQWIIIGMFLNWKSYQMPDDRYGWWLAFTFLGVAALAWTDGGRKFPINIILTIFIVECTTLYIALEQQNSKGLLANFYVSVIVISLVAASIFWGAYFPMRLVPGDLVLSLLVAAANLMMIVFFINAYFFESKSVFTAVRNFFAIVAVCMIMYTATIIHDRQFDVPKNEYLFLSVQLFFAYIILNERILRVSLQHYEHVACHQ